MLKTNIQLFSDDATVQTDPVTTPDTNDETQTVVENQQETPPQVDPTPQPEPSVDFPTFNSKEDYDKHIQSTRSKAKGEILKDLGFDSVADIKTKIEGYKDYEDLKASKDTLSTEIESLKAQLSEKDLLIQSYQDKELIRTVGIPAESAETFINLLNADNRDIPRIDKAKELVKELGKMFSGGVQIGVNKSNNLQENKQLGKTMADLRKL